MDLHPPAGVTGLAAPPPFTVVTPRLTLDAVTVADAPALRSVVTRPEVGRMLVIFPPDWTVAAAEAMIPSWAWRGTADFRLAIRDRGAFIGAVGLRAIEGRVWLAYFLAPEVAGRGLATEAVGAFLAAVDASLDLPEIWADVFTDNPASARVLEKCGFVPAGTATGCSAARLEPVALWLYRRSRGGNRQP
jgi:RimJ/RimL family protein N-acetyltransferase